MTPAQLARAEHYRQRWDAIAAAAADVIAFCAYHHHEPSRRMVIRWYTAASAEARYSSILRTIHTLEETP